MWRCEFSISEVWISFLELLAKVVAGLNVLAATSKSDPSIISAYGISDIHRDVDALHRSLYYVLPSNFIPIFTEFFRLKLWPWGPKPWPPETPTKQKPFSQALPKPSLANRMSRRSNFSPSFCPWWTGSVRWSRRLAYCARFYHTSPSQFFIFCDTFSVFLNRGGGSHRRGYTTRP